MKKKKKKNTAVEVGGVKEGRCIMYNVFVQVAVGSNAAATHFEIGPGLPTKTDRSAASTSQSIFPRHLLGLENLQILTFNSAGIQS